MSSKFKSYYKNLKPDSQYRDPTYKGTTTEYRTLIQSSTTLYIGNISETVSEERIWELFSLVGLVKRVIMGVNKYTHLFCKFTFVEYYNRNDAENAVVLYNGFRLDNKFLNVDFDYGYCDGRQYGRKERKRNLGKNQKRMKYI